MGFLITPNQLESGSNGVQPPGDFDFHGLPVGHTRRTKSAKLLDFFVFTHYHWPYPLVNSYITIEHHHLYWIYPLNLVIFHSYVNLPEGRFHVCVFCINCFSLSCAKKNSGNIETSIYY